MTMQIKAVVLYGHDGRVRRLPFRLGALNVITGESGTGKSAIINIVDYCLGRDSCPVPARVIRDAVRWYALLLRVGDGEVFVARAAPVPPRQTSQEVMLRVGETVEPPPLDQLAGNTNPGGLSDTLTRMLGVSPNLHVPPEGQSRDPLEATIHHAKLLCLQYQDEIAKKDCLFHRQGDMGIAQAIRDTLPYFLGAVPEDQLKVRQEYRDARRDLKMLERRLSEAQAVSGAGASRATAFVREAAAVGLLPAGAAPADVPAAVALLRTVRFTPAAEESSRVGEEVRRLRRERAELRQAHDRLHREIDEAEEFAAGGEGFAAVAAEQKARLASINVVGGGGSADESRRCPLCQGEVGGQVPRVAQVREALAGVERHVAAVRAEGPDLGAFLTARRAELGAVAERLRVNREATDALVAQDNDLRAQRDRDFERFRVVSRIELFLESAGTLADDSEPRRQVEAARQRVADLEARLREDDAEEVLRSAVSRVSQQVSRWSEELGLEYGRFPLRLDLTKLTLVADTDRGPVPMSQMGSGQNWLWCHLLVYFALHKFFVEQGRPVPRFLRACPKWGRR
ncbi:MAG: DUF3732 domain-containing protein [Gemmataceae bacterium]|nr:DUF3732 domain-containing protein [Gemmataceae bacterium]